MKTTDKVSKEVLGLFEYSKDLTKANLTSANSAGDFKPVLSDDQLLVLNGLIDNSISQAFQRTLSNFQKNLDNIISVTSEKQPESSSFFRKKK